MQKLQYAALRKCTRVVVGARMESVSKIAVVESGEMHLDAMQVHFMARAIGDPRGVGDLVFRAEGRPPTMLDTDMMAKVLAGVVDPEVEEGGICPRVNVDIVDL